MSLASLPVSRSLLTATFPTCSLPWFLKHIRTGDAQPLPFHRIGESVPAVWKSGPQWKVQSERDVIFNIYYGGIRHMDKKRSNTMNFGIPSPTPTATSIYSFANFHLCSVSTALFRDKSCTTLGSVCSAFVCCAENPELETQQRTQICTHCAEIEPRTTK